jgi:hypothetical protein
MVPEHRDAPSGGAGYVRLFMAALKPLLAVLAGLLSGYLRSL